eukprot:TRINITY_DN58348_c0_g1_i1.p1 TRINITY_DN58348_c0_g1~~TRINITY_DN58348_c0_g1_i1.p1  ORF type:complete len:807 (+),score=158.80 TRINITY_DN58348_c0_g1_i1:127-2547(+)
MEGTWQRQTRRQSSRSISPDWWQKRDRTPPPPAGRCKEESADERPGVSGLATPPEALGSPPRRAVPEPLGSPPRRPLQQRHGGHHGGRSRSLRRGQGAPAAGPFGSSSSSGRGRSAHSSVEPPGDLSGDDTPPLSAQVAVRRPPPPPPPPPPAPPRPASAEVEAMVLDALRHKNVQIPTGWPAIVAAAYQDELDSVQWLLTARADANAATQNKSSALWHAVSNQNVRMVQALVQARADVNHSKKNAKGVRRSVLDMAINDTVPPPILQALCSAGAKEHTDLQLPKQSSILALMDTSQPAALHDFSAAKRNDLSEGARHADRDEPSQSGLWDAKTADSFEGFPSSVGNQKRDGAKTDDDLMSEISSPSTPPLGSALGSSRAGSAYAARSAFKKAYSRQMLPLRDEKPVLDFSVYKAASTPSTTEIEEIKPPPKKRCYAGLVDIPRVRGSPLHERERARICFAVAGEHVEPRSQQDRTDLLTDHWGCVMAGNNLAGVPLTQKTQGSPSLECKKDMPVPVQARPLPEGGVTELLPEAQLLKYSAAVSKAPPGSRPLEAAEGVEVKEEANEKIAGNCEGRRVATEAASGATVKAEGLLGLPNMLQEALPRQEDSNDSATDCAEKRAEPPLPPMRSIPGFPGDRADAMAGGLDDTRLSEQQMQLVKELAGGAKFHDPARDPTANADQARNACLVEVGELKFCHKNIGPKFTHGAHRGLPVLSLLEDLHSGRVEPRQLPALVVMRSKLGLQVVCGNRRLYCLKRFAAEAARSVDAWCVVYDLKSKDTPRPLVFKYILAATTEDPKAIGARSM